MRQCAPLVCCFALLLSACSSNKPGAGQCVDTASCPAGQACVNSACRKLCNSNNDCTGGLVCGPDSLCRKATGEPPQITGLDGDGTPDGATGHAAHHIAAQLHILGNHLTGSTVDLALADSSQSFTGLVPADTSSDARLDVVLPNTFVAGDYIISVTNAAGSAQTTATILQGEPGQDGTTITGDEIITKINTARTAGTPLVADQLGSLTAQQVSDRLDALETTRPASPNLLLDTRLFRSIPAGQIGLTNDAGYGVWRFFIKNDSGDSVLVEDADADLLAQIQSGSPTWWPWNVKMLHVKFSPNGTDPGRVLQQVQPSVKSGPMTTSAWVKVVSGTLYVGHESQWDGFTNSTWQRVSSTTTTPTATLGGAYGFAGQSGVFTEAYIALPKVEASPVATPYIESPKTQSWSDSKTVSSCPSANTASSGYTIICTSNKTVTLPRSGNVLVNWSIAAYSSATGARWNVRVNLGGQASPSVACFTNEAGSHKGCSGTAIIPAAAGTQTLQLEVSVGQQNFYQDGNDHAVWTAYLLP